MGATTDQYLYLDLYWIGDAVFIDVRREKKTENENNHLDLQKFSMINMTSVNKILKKLVKWILDAVQRWFCVMIPLIHPLYCQNK